MLLKIKTLEGDHKIALNLDLMSGTAFDYYHASCTDK